MLMELHEEIAELQMLIATCPKSDPDYKVMQKELQDASAKCRKLENTKGHSPCTATNANNTADEMKRQLS